LFNAAQVFNGVLRQAPAGRLRINLQRTIDQAVLLVQ